MNALEHNNDQQIKFIKNTASATIKVCLNYQRNEVPLLHELLKSPLIQVPPAEFYQLQEQPFLYFTILKPNE